MQNHFNTLGRDPIGLIMQELPIESAVALGSTCKKMKTVLGAMWHFFLKRDFGYELKEPLKIYKEEYHCRHHKKTDGFLRQAVHFGWIIVVRCVLRANPRLDDDGDTALSYAIGNDDVEIARLLLQNKKVYPGRVGPRMFVWAAKRNYVDVVATLLKTVTPDIRVMEVAAKNGHPEVVKLLLEDGRVDPSTSIGIAARHNHLEVVKLLLEDARVDPSINDNYAFLAAVANGHINVADLLSTDPRVNKTANLR